MNDKKYSILLNKINGLIDAPLKLAKDMSVEQLTNNQLMMAHVRLHNMYPIGTKEINKEDIENLHNKIKEKINHNNFDFVYRK